MAHKLLLKQKFHFFLYLKLVFTTKTMRLISLKNKILIKRFLYLHVSLYSITKNWISMVFLNDPNYYNLCHIIMVILDWCWTAKILFIFHYLEEFTLWYCYMRSNNNIHIDENFRVPTTIVGLNISMAAHKSKEKVFCLHWKFH